jgi:hypothetical protein
MISSAFYWSQRLSLGTPAKGGAGDRIPAGVPPLPFTVAAKVTGSPSVLGFGVEANVMIAVVEETFCVRVVLLPENKSGSVGT